MFKKKKKKKNRSGRVKVMSIRYGKGAFHIIFFIGKESRLRGNKL